MRNCGLSANATPPPHFPILFAAAKLVKTDVCVSAAYNSDSPAHATYPVPVGSPYALRVVHKSGKWQCQDGDGGNFFNLV